MPVLKFLCPTTRLYFDSGIRLDETSAAASRLSIVRVRCSQCRREHRFLLADGVLDSSESFSKRRQVNMMHAKNTANRGSSGLRCNDHNLRIAIDNYFCQ